MNGKCTMHVMINIMVSHQISINDFAHCIPRIQERFLNIQLISMGNLCNVFPYRKPLKRPDPVFVSSSTNLQIDGKDEHNEVQTREILYNILDPGKLFEAQEQNDPPWAKVTDDIDL